MRLTLRKEEKLRHRALVEGLFAEGRSIYEFPLRMVWRVLRPEELERSFKAGVPDRVGHLQMLVTVPKKKRRKAVDRVLMRRRIREAYRLNRIPLKEKVESDLSGGQLQIAFVYLATENIPYAVVEARMKILLSRLADRI